MSWSSSWNERITVPSGYPHLRKTGCRQAVLGSARPPSLALRMEHPSTSLLEAQDDHPLADAGDFDNDADYDADASRVMAAVSANNPAGLIDGEEEVAVPTEYLQDDLGTKIELPASFRAGRLAHFIASRPTKLLGLMAVLAVFTTLWVLLGAGDRFSVDEILFRPTDDLDVVRFIELSHDLPFSAASQLGGGRRAEGGKSRRPRPWAAPRLPAWWPPRLCSLAPTPKCILISSDARRSLGSAPHVAPTLRISRSFRATAGGASPPTGSKALRTSRRSRWCTRSAARAPPTCWASASSRRSTTSRPSSRRCPRPTHRHLLPFAPPPPKPSLPPLTSRHVPR